jgi:carboxypeptidase PM20D1
VIKRVLIGLLLLLLGLGAALAVNTLRQRSSQLPVQPLAPLTVDRDGAAKSLATAVRARTISGLLDPAGQAQAFEQLHQHLKARYPLLHQRAQREVVAGRTLVFKLAGSDAAARPIAWLAHQDVVPIAPGTESLWKQPPFDGVVSDGFVWGRGAWDNKGNLIAQLEAVEMLLKSGFTPKRTVFLVFGHDEEVGGREGALQVAALFKQRNIRLDYVLDEGLVVTEGIVPGISAPVALIGVAEKGYVTLKLVATATPGHSSQPPAPGQSAIGMLSAALAKLDAKPLPGGIAGVSQAMFDTLAPEMALPQRVVLGNLWLFRPVAENMLAKSPSTNALIRTTTALTIVNAGNKENVLPGRAEALVNFRLLPGDSVDTVLAHVKKVVADERIEVSTLPGPMPPSKVATSDNAAYSHIATTAREVFGGALAAPGLMLGGTDGRHFEDVADAVYRFSPVRARAADLTRFHGTDERIAIDNLAEMIRFYHRLLQQSAN